MPTHVQEACIITQQNLPKDALVLRNDHPIPSAEKGEVLVKVQAAALNPVGYKLMKMVPDFLAKRPPVAGYDLAGVVEGPNDYDFTKGDAVFGYIPVPLLSMKRKEGALQHIRLIARRRDSVAIEGLLEFGKLEAGQSVFINGGSSSVGAYAIQIAKAKGASRVVATASGKNEEFVRNLGADVFIDYTKQPLHEYLLQNPTSTKFDVIFDAVGLQEPDLYKNSPDYLASGGTFVSVVPSRISILPFLRTLFAVALPKWLGGNPCQYKTFTVIHKRADLQEIADLVAEGKIKPAVDSVYEFNDVLSAYERIMTSRAKGKVVVKVDFSTRYIA